MGMASFPRPAETWEDTMNPMEISSGSSTPDAGESKLHGWPWYTKKPFLLAAVVVLVLVVWRSSSSAPEKDELVIGQPAMAGGPTEDSTRQKPLAEITGVSKNNTRESADGLDVDWLNKEEDDDDDFESEDT